MKKLTALKNLKIILLLRLLRYVGNVKHVGMLGQQQSKVDVFVELVVIDARGKKLGKNVLKLWN